MAGIVGGVLSGLIFKTVWKVVGRGSDAPAPMDSERGWGEILLAAVLHGAIYALVKAAVDRGAAEWTRKATGIWPGSTLQQPGKSPDHHEAKAVVRTDRVTAARAGASYGGGRQVGMQVGGRVSFAVAVSPMGKRRQTTTAGTGFLGPGPGQRGGRIRRADTGR